MRLFSYVVTRDYGFAPNPFFCICTLATCKPIIRRIANIDDWVVGTGSSKTKRKGYLVYAMRVTEAMTFNEYWSDPRFQRKKPNLRGSKKQAFGDNIYYKRDNSLWHQLDSHHSYKGGTPNRFNIENDTQTDRVLISTDYSYFGGEGPKIPKRFRGNGGSDICAGRNHKSQFLEKFINDFVIWIRSLETKGYLGVPIDWSRTP